MESLVSRFNEVRKRTLGICSELQRDDYMVQSTNDVSPPKWHLGHTTWFFETFILRPFLDSYEEFDSRFEFIFNSYYNSVGKFLAKQNRMLLSRPSLEDVLRYRSHVETSMLKLLPSLPLSSAGEIAGRLAMGINHEQQHQELLVMDIKENMYRSPYRPGFSSVRRTGGKASSLSWKAFDGGVVEIGYGGDEFSYDNEHPRHREFVAPLTLSSRLVTNGEYMRFIMDGGYDEPGLWLSDGWDTVKREGWKMPHYWEETEHGFEYFTPWGMTPVDPDEPVCHVSFYEADAYARWAGYSLPTEGQWEHAFSEMNLGIDDAGSMQQWHPAVQSGEVFHGAGACWEWTSSAYRPYPGYTPPAGAIGEYNGKFMAQQMVLRGASCATPPGHSRITYRNFYHPDSRWQFSGIRLSGEGSE